jgi:hypothetical protein
MATTKLEFSLRLRHDTDDLSQLTQQLGFVTDVGWNKGEKNRAIDGSLRDGIRDLSYRSFPLGIAASVDMDDAICECLTKLTPFSSELRSFVNSGGIASFAVAWFCDSAVGGDRIPAEHIAEMARLSLTLDVYLYFSPHSSIDSELDETSVS